jgi:hypothetical protein
MTNRQATWRETADIIHLLRYARKGGIMSQPKEQQAAQTSMADIIERLADELTLAEEPARFIGALEGEEAEPGDE